ncbi:MAG: hypothetical protein JOZ16_16505 [Methylobacteriaceae bacterium]|nr:hypothetical protein [Methylobacteriaceae bacterium]
MSDLEDLNAKAARLWLEFMQAQAKAATDVARKLPDVTRSLAQAGLPLAAEVKSWIEGALPAPARPVDVPPQAAAAEPAPPVATTATGASGDDQSRAALKSRSARPLVRVNHRRLKAPKSMSRRRRRRA